jgi:NAD(P)-dependent dehydrogenase (short-subunit alcohol dehydrogenase family)
MSEGKVSVVFGGGNGIGAACCRLMARRGWRVVVVDLQEEAAAAVAREIQGNACRERALGFGSSL